jgi:hypothetical protein
MNRFTITARTATGQRITYSALAACSADAARDAADLFGDTPCGITVTCQA